MKKGKIMGIVFSNANDSSINELTKSRSMSAIPFAGRYRLIDFMLSNMVSTKIYEIGVVTRENYYSLVEHLGAGKEWDLARKNDGLHFITPYSNEDSGLYSGRMQGLGNALSLIQDSNAEFVLVASCDRVFNSDFKDMVASHIKTNADITLMHSKRSTDTLNMAYTSVVKFDADNRVTELTISPKVQGEVNMYVNVAVMNKEFLEELIVDSLSKGLYDFERDVLQPNINNMKVYAYEHKGELKAFNSLKQYYNANMALLDEREMTNLFNPLRPIYTKVNDSVPTRYGLDSKVSNSLIADGCVVEGEVENSILFRDVRVMKGAKIKDSIIMQNGVIGVKSTVQYTITDRDVEVGDYKTIGGTEEYPMYIPKNEKV